MTLTQAVQQHADTIFVEIVSHLVDLARVCDSIIAVNDGWED